MNLYQITQWIACLIALSSGNRSVIARAGSPNGVAPSMKNAFDDRRHKKPASQNYDQRYQPTAYGPYSSNNPFEKHSLASLKWSLMHGYDKDLRPVLNESDLIEVEVDVIYRQVLHMDEKNQILTSLVWYRQHWQDAHLHWKPADHSGVREFWLPADSVWKPDIVLQEETGTKDYSPRLPFVKVNYDGHLEYREPTTFATSCSMNTMHFPFDVQHCNLTFSSWSHPGTKISLNPERTLKEMEHDYQIYINTGEWSLEYIGVTKRMANYSDLSTESKSEYIDWPEVAFTITLKRNSSFYVQSLILPSILLTTIALIGFFLPPGSGERVGLQITILLTFMVFLLTVSEMFPASSGPYLGYYYVICVFLLAVNLLMTVLVLHLYYHTNSPVPHRMKAIVVGGAKFFNLDVANLEEYNNKAGDFRNYTPDQIKSTRSCLCNVMLSCFKEHEIKSSSENLGDAGMLRDEKINEVKQQVLRRPRCHYKEQCRPNRSGISFTRTRRRTEFRACQGCKFYKKRVALDREYIYRGRRVRIRHPANHSCAVCTNTGLPASNRKDAAYRIESETPVNEFAAKQPQSELRAIFDAIQALKPAEETHEEQESEWKMMANYLDKVFWRIYLLIFSFSHAAIMLAAILTASSIEPHNEHASK